MKKLFAVLCLCIIILLCSCGEAKNNFSSKDTIHTSDSSTEENSVEVNNEYIPLLYGISVGAGKDSDTEKYIGEQFFSVEKYEKAITEKKNVDIFGDSQSVTYNWTLKCSDLPYDLDEYSFVKGREAVFVSYRTDTNKVVKYQKNTAANRIYQSAVDPYSSEEDYIAYAGSVLLEISGVSVDGWDVKIQTWRSEYGYTDGFIHYIHEVPSYNAEYIITFSKTISGIERCDKMFVHMTNVGEIIEICAVNYDKAFSPYANVQIDKTKLEEAAWNAFDNIRKNHNIVSEKIQSIELIAQNDVLWAQVTIEYRLGETKGGVQYVIELARH